MSNAANKNGDKTKPVAILNDVSKGDNTLADNSSNLEAEQVVPSSEAVSESQAGFAPHLVVVAPDALNAERMGPRLRAAREKKGWSLELAAKETRIHKDYLSAIEDMMPNLLPGMPKSQSYLRGYLNNYAKSLGMPDPKDVVQRFLNECGLLALEPTDEELEKRAKDSEAKEKRSWIAPVVLSIAATLIACGSVAAYVMKPWEQDTETNVSATAAVEENTVYSNAAVMAPASASDLSLHALTRAWIEVRGSDGTVYLSRELAPGAVYVPRIGAGWTITARDGGAFEWYLSGQSLGTLAEPGLPVYANSVDEVLTRQPVEGNELLH